MPTTVFLVRHGRAESAEANGDAARHLTPEGVNELRESCVGLRRLAASFHRVLVSPLVRASETAAVLVEELAPAAAVETIPALAPGGAGDEVIAALAARDEGAIAVIGHAPDLVELAGRLLAPGQRDVAALSPGGVVCIEFESRACAGAGRLGWAHAPAALRRVAQGRPERD